MSLSVEKKMFLMNTGLLLGVAALFFRGYLPVTEEIASQNEQLHTFERQLQTLKQDTVSLRQKSEKGGKVKVYAVPEAEIELFGQELEALAQKHQVRLIHVEPDKEQQETVSKLKVSLTPYSLGFSTKDSKQLASLLTDLELNFPEVGLQDFTYSKEVASVEALVLTSSQSVRLFSP